MHINNCCPRTKSNNKKLMKQLWFLCMTGDWRLELQIKRHVQHPFQSKNPKNNIEMPPLKLKIYDARNLWLYQPLR